MNNRQAAPFVAMLVEDEPLIRMMAVDILTEAGFIVLETEHADAAILMLEAKAEKMHALFTDIHMPGSMDGLGLAHHARLHWPWIGLMLASGLKRPEAADTPEGSRFLAKPYSSGHLLEGVRELVAAI